MAISNKHAKTSGIADGGDSSLVQPSDWNAEHDLTCAANRMLGNFTSSDGDVTEGDASTVRTFLASGVVNDETASYTAVLADVVVVMDNASANNFTVPANASVAYPIGWFLEVWQKGAGQTTIVADTGVTILYHADLTLKLKGQNSGCSLRKVGTNTWRLIGDMEWA